MVDKNTGAFTMTYPIDIPPGRNGLQPNLNLVYNSQDTQLGGIFGEGWSISIPYVARLNKTGVDKLYSATTPDYFTSSLDGELVATSTATSTKHFSVDTGGTLTNGLQAYYKMDDGTEYYVGDGSLDLANTGAVPFDAGRIGNASDHGTESNGKSLHVGNNLGITGGAISIAFWFQATSTQAHDWWIIDQTDGTNYIDNRVAYRYNGGSPYLQFGRNKSGVAEQDANATHASSTLGTGWHFIVYSYDGTTVKGYLDNALIATTTASGNGTSAQANLFATGNYGGGEDYIDGKVDEAGVWNRALTTTEISDLYNGGSGQTIAGPGIANTGPAMVARTENGSFNQYSYSTTTNQWTMTDKNGTQYVFGSTSDSQQNDPANASDTFKWMVKQITDTNGNTAVYNYVNDSGQIYPSSTVYTGTATSTGIFEVDFLKQSRPDTATSSFTGFGASSQYRINEIDAKVNGTWVRKYALGYTAGDNASTSLLSTITESGENASGTVVTLPTSTFAYQRQTPGWTTSSTWNPPVGFLDWNQGNSNGVQIGDANGNNLSGLLQSVVDNPNTPSGTFAGWVDNGHGWTSSSTWKPPTGFLDWNYNSSNGAQVVPNMTGNGMPGIIVGITDHSGSADVYQAWVDTGSGWVASSTWNPPVPLLDWYYGTDEGVRVIDVNGDGLPDIIQGVTGQVGSPTSTFAAWINNGHGWARNDTWDPPVGFLDWNSSQDTGWRIADVNGDGLPDILGSSGAYINNGHGWTFDASWASPLPFWDSTNKNDYGVRIADVNGDGLPDIIQGAVDEVGGGSSFAAYINTGHGWTASSSWNPPASFLDVLSSNDDGSRIADVVGSGLPGVIQSIVDHPNASDTDLAWVNNNSVRANLLTSITYPQGASTTIQYQPIVQGNLSNIAPYPVYVAAQVTSNDGLGNLASTSYQYSGGSYYVSGPTDKQFAGFSNVTETDAAGNVTKTYYHTGTGTATSTGEYADNYWKIGKPYRIESYDNANNLFKKVINRWDSVSLGGNAAFVKLASTTEMDYDGLGTHKDIAESYAYDPLTGNQTQKVQWGQVNANDDGTFTDTGTDDFTTNTTYATSTTGVVGKPSDVIITDHAGTKIKEAQYYYDSLALGSASKGNLTKESDWKSGSSYASSQDTYNSYGLVTVDLDPRNNTTTYSYDSYNLYPATTTNALSQSTGYQYDYSTGKKTQTIDPNGDLFQTVYDGLGRPLTLTAPDPANASTTVTTTAYTYADTANAVSVHESDYMSASASVDTYRYYDGLNRLIQTRKSAEDSPNYKVSDRAYNVLGLLQKESLPYIASGTPKSTATTTSALFTNYVYDALSRMLTSQNAVGTTTNTYSNWKVATTDPRGKEKDAYHDAYNNLIQVDEHNGTSTFSTFYAYDGLQDLKNVTDTIGNVRAFTYDGLGRRLTAQDLHPSSSVTFGTWNYTYDDAGNLTQQVDPKNQTSTYALDVLNRVTSESFGGQTQIAYTYDTCPQGIGRLCVASSSDAVVTSTYNGLGQVIGETKTIATSSFTTSYTYDRQGNQLSITNPNNAKVTYTYNLAGLPETVTYLANGGGTTNIVTNFDYSPTDQPTVIAYANGVTQTNTYDPTKLYRLTQKVGSLPGGGNAQNTSYTYDADGNITQVIDTGNSGAGRTVNYGYDDLNRLTSAATTNVSTTPSYSQTFTYDPLGNILTGSAGTYAYGGTGYPNPDAATSIVNGTSTTNFAYDNDGNLLSTGTATDTWNYRNLLTQLVAPSGTSAYAYDYLGNRVKLAEGSTTTLFPNRFYNVILGASTSTAHIFANGILLATVIDVSTSTVSAKHFQVDSGGTLTNGIKAYYKAEDATEFYVGDGSLNLTNIGSVAFDSGKVNNAADHGTENNTKSLNVNNNMGVTGGPISMAFWFQGVASQAHDWWILAQVDATNKVINRIAFRPNGGSAFLGFQRLESGAGEQDANFSTSTLGTSFRFLAYTYDGSSIYGYLDGKLVASASSTGNGSATQSNHFSTSNYGGAEDYGAGKVDELGVWNRALTQTEISDLYNGGSGQTMAGSSSTPVTVNYALTDNLGGTAAVTNASGTVVEALDYYPYLQARLDNTTSPYGGEKRKAIGEEYDLLSKLNYFNARYYDNSRGQFISEDPSYLVIGDPALVKQHTGQDQQAFLSDPQQYNAYSYARDNPIVKEDPNGNCPMCVTALLGAGGGIVGQFAVDVFHDAQANGFNVNKYTFSTQQTYLTRAAQGAVIGLTGGVAGALGIGLAGQAAVVGVASAGVGAAGNKYLGQPNTPQSVIFDATIGAATFGAAELAPGVSGRLPSFGTQSFFTGAHTQENALKVGVDAVSSYLSSALTDISTSYSATRVDAAPGTAKQSFSTPNGINTSWMNNTLLK